MSRSLGNLLLIAERALTSVNLKGENLTLPNVNGSSFRPFKGLRPKRKRMVFGDWCIAALKVSDNILLYGWLRF